MQLGSIEAEYAGAELGDRRLEYRLSKVAGALQEDPDVSLPRALKSNASIEGAYRLLRNQTVTADGILSGHFEQTVTRAAEHKCVIAIHDTTIFEFSGDSEREDLGQLRGKGQGFLGHFTLLAAVGDPVVPLGVLSLSAIVRRERGQARPKQGAPDNEGQRWLEGIKVTEGRLDGRVSVVHVMDREADSYPLMTKLLERGQRFIVRSKTDRRQNSEEEARISDALAGARTVVERSVMLTKRINKNSGLTRKQPAREARTARLAISAVSTTILRPPNVSDLPETLQVNVVQVREVQPPPDSEPVHWVLLTSEPITKRSELERIVDSYRARWMIEEYFKAIKTGCAYEKSQMESLHTLLNSLALVVPIAWRLLLLRSLSRQAPDIPASKALTKTQLAILAKRRYGHLPPKATIRQAMLAVAGLGGHIKNNGDPGWIVLGRGFEDLIKLEEGWLAAKDDF